MDVYQIDNTAKQYIINSSRNRNKEYAEGHFVFSDSSVFVILPQFFRL